MLILNRHPTHNKPLDPRDAETLGVDAAAEVERYLSHRDNHVPMPLHALPALAAGLEVSEFPPRYAARYTHVVVAGAWTLPDGRLSATFRRRVERGVELTRTAGQPTPTLMFIDAPGQETFWRISMVSLRRVNALSAAAAPPTAGMGGSTMIVTASVQVSPAPSCS